MKWTLQSSGNPSEFVLVSDDDQKITFKYSSAQQSIRMRFNEHFGVYVLDEKGFGAKKLSIRNVYGSEIGYILKGTWRETTGSIALDDISEKYTYEIFSTNSTIEITTASSVKNEVRIIDAMGKESYILALIVFSWMQSVTAVHVAEVF
jgi:hypothetical protein